MRSAPLSCLPPLQTQLTHAPRALPLCLYKKSANLILYGEGGRLSPDGRGAYRILRFVGFNFFLLLQEKVTKRIANLRQVDRLCKPWRSARKPGETPHPLPESVAPFTRFFGSRAAMPASCFAQGALTELLFPPFHNLFPPSSACNFFICFLRNSIIFLSKRKQSYAPRALPLHLFDKIC